MSFDGFDPGAIALLRELPRWDAQSYAAEKERLKRGVSEPLPKIVAKAGFSGWCVTRLERLLPIHEWLVSELVATKAKAAK
jgi:hypothetical protein